MTFIKNMPIKNGKKFMTKSEHGEVLNIWHYYRILSSLNKDANFLVTLLWNEIHSKSSYWHFPLQCLNYFEWDYALWHEAFKKKHRYQNGKQPVIKITITIAPHFNFWVFYIRYIVYIFPALFHMPEKIYR